MSWVKIIRILDREQAINGLTCIRREWQEAANGKPLMAMQGNVGLMLEDVAYAMGLLPEEVIKVLGNEAVTDPAKLRSKV